jgi:hypothetical protein
MMAHDEWVRVDAATIDHAVLSQLRHVLEDVSPIIVEHRFYRGGRAPERLIFDDSEALEQYLSDNASPGDSFHFWRFSECCTDENAALRGKIPDAEGRIPVGGSY